MHLSRNTKQKSGEALDQTLPVMDRKFTLVGRQRDGNSLLSVDIFTSLVANIVVRGDKTVGTCT